MGERRDHETGVFGSKRVLNFYSSLICLGGGREIGLAVIYAASFFTHTDLLIKNIAFFEVHMTTKVEINFLL